MIKYSKLDAKSLVLSVEILLYLYSIVTEDSKSIEIVLVFRQFAYRLRQVLFELLIMLRLHIEFNRSPPMYLPQVIQHPMHLQVNLLLEVYIT